MFAGFFQIYGDTAYRNNKCGYDNHVSGHKRYVFLKKVIDGSEKQIKGKYVSG
jgi:hypothetical protein